MLPDSPELAAARAEAPPPIAPALMDFHDTAARGPSLHGRIDTAPFVGALALSDEVSRAALSLLSASREDYTSRRKET
jgi:hypothetical protein